MLHARWHGKAAPAAAALAVLALGLSGASPAVAADPGQVRINEIESNGGTPGAYLVLDVESSYGLGSEDEVRLYRSGGSTLVDSYAWSMHASTTYGRCVDGTGAFATTTASTRGGKNACAGGGSSQGAWPGGAAVAVADGANVFGENLSGLSFESAGVLWAVNNGPGKLYRLVPNGATWRPDNAWSSGKSLRYANGSGDPDAEGVVVTPEGLYVATERDNDKDGTSLPKVLRYDVSASGGSLNATSEWNLKADLPAVAANSGLEGISWIPDSFLTAHGFRDERTGTTYAPSGYPGHGAGLFFVGLEASGTVYAYALNQTGGGYTRVATIPTGFSAVMELEFEASAGRLWASCDDTCQGRSATLAIDAQGKFTATAVYDRPTGMATSTTRASLSRRGVPAVASRSCGRTTRTTTTMRSARGR